MGWGGTHDWGDGCKIKVGFHKTEIHRRRPFHCFRAFHAALTEALGSISCFQRLVVHSLLYNEDTTVDRRGSKQGGCWILMMRRIPSSTLQKWSKPTIVKGCFKLLSIHPFSKPTSCCIYLIKAFIRWREGYTLDKFLVHNTATHTQYLEFPVTSAPPDFSKFFCQFGKSSPTPSPAPSPWVYNIAERLSASAPGRLSCPLCPIFFHCFKKL